MSSLDDTYMYRLATLNEHTLTMSRIDVPWNPRSRNSLVATSTSSVRRGATRSRTLIVVGMFDTSEIRAPLAFRAAVATFARH